MVTPGVPCSPRPRTPRVQVRLTAPRTKPNNADSLLSFKSLSGRLCSARSALHSLTIIINDLSKCWLTSSRQMLLLQADIVWPSRTREAHRVSRQDALALIKIWFQFWRRQESFSKSATRKLVATTTVIACWGCARRRFISSGSRVREGQRRSPDSQTCRSRWSTKRGSRFLSLREDHRLWIWNLLKETRRDTHANTTSIEE